MLCSHALFARSVRTPDPACLRVRPATPRGAARLTRERAAASAAAQPDEWQADGAGESVHGLSSPGPCEPSHPTPGPAGTAPDSPGAIAEEAGSLPFGFSPAGALLSLRPDDADAPPGLRPSAPGLLRSPFCTPS
jgi:hypothetical protein